MTVAHVALGGSHLAAALLVLGACGQAEPPSLARVVAWAPQGTGVPVDASASIDLSESIGPDGELDGRRVALARAKDVKGVAAAVESEAGLGPDASAVACAVALARGGRRIELTPLAPLAAGAVHAVVLGPLRDRNGHAVLDPEGRRRTFIATFETEPGPPPRPVITEVLARAATPEAGGEYVEVQNRGVGPLDLEGWRFTKRTTAGTVASCTLTIAVGGPVLPGGYALLTGLAWDDRYGVPADVARYTCGSASLAGGLPDDRPPEVQLLDAAGVLQSSLGAGGVAPECEASVERVAPDGSDVAGNLACALGAGTPGACNSVTPGYSCR
jgi:hypothetical protein